MTEDRELIRRALAGERGAFDEIVARYQDGLYRHLLRLCGRSEEAEDLCQESFIRLYRSLRRFNPERPLTPFLFTIATNVWRKRLPRAGREVALFYEASGAEGDPVSEKVFSRLEHQQVLAAVAQLQPEQREAVSLFYDQGLSYREIAGITGAPVGTVSTRLKRALETLRQALAAGGAGLVIPGVGDLPQYLTSTLQGQGAAPGSIGPAVAHGIATAAPAGFGLIALWKEAGVMMKGIYLAIGLAIVGGAVVGVPRLMSHSIAAPPPARVEIAKVKAKAPPKEMGLSADMVETVEGRKTESGKFYNKGARSRVESYNSTKIQILRRDKNVMWTLIPTKKTYYQSPMGNSLGAGSKRFDVDALAQVMGLSVPAAKTLLGQERVNGYLCDKYSLTPESKGSKVNSVLVWYAEKPGMVVRLKNIQNQKVVHTDFTNIRSVDLPDSLFELPAGYTLQSGAQAGPGSKEEAGAASPSVAPQEFSANQTMMEGSDVISARYYVKGQKTRIEFDSSKIIQIRHYDKNMVLWVLRPADKTYKTLTFKNSKVRQAPTFSLDNIIRTMVGLEAVTKQLLGQEEVNGYLCDKYSLTPVDKNNKTRLVVWVAKKFSLVVRLQGRSGNDSWQNDLKDIRIGNVPDSLFEVPEGYTRRELLRPQSSNPPGK